MLPRIRARARHADNDRRVPRETIDEILETGLFGLVAPRMFGGSELGFASLFEVTALLASACGSTGWLFGVLAGHSHLLNLFPERAQEEVWREPRALISTLFRLSGESTRVPGGYRLRNCEGRFCSGIDYSSWIILGATVTGYAEFREPRFFLVPRADVIVIDDWYTAGLRGTGSRTIRIADTFVPEYRSVALADMLAGKTPGASLHRLALYRISFRDVVPFSIAGVPVGIARGAIDCFVAGLSRRRAMSTDEPPPGIAATCARLASAAAEVDAAYALVLRDAERLDALTDPAELSAVDRARFARNWAYSAQVSRYAVTRLFEAAGGTGVYDSSELQRAWRDVNAASQHYAFGWDNAMTGYGQAALDAASSELTGLENS